MMFIIEGLPPVLWAFVWWRLVADRPREARLASAPPTAHALEAQLAQEQRGIAPVRNYARRLQKPAGDRAVRRSISSGASGVYGFVIWLPSMLKTADMGMVEVGWLSAVPYLAAVIGGDFHLRLVGPDRQAPGAGVALPGAGGGWPFMAPICWAARNFWASFALLVIAGAMMYAPYGPFFAYLAETLPANVAGGAIALINSMGALGSFVGAYGVGLLNGITGSSGASYLMMAAALIVSAVITFCPARRKAR